jgi:Cys-rich four helix bundle protein (predicted Tat secretion target)
MTIGRRDVLLAGAGVVTAGLLGSGVAVAGAPAAAGPAPALADTATACVAAGDACLQHCLDRLAQGDTSLGECAQSVRQMLAVCGAVGPLASAGGKHLAAAARLCIEVCGDCEQVCRKHEHEHPPCKRCAEACARTVAEAKKVVA